MKLTEGLMQKKGTTSWDITSGSRERSLPATLWSVATNSLGRAESVKMNDDLKHIWNDILNRQLTELDSCFQEDQYGIIRALAAFLLLSSLFSSLSDTEHPCQRVANALEFLSLKELLHICPLDIFQNHNKLLGVIITPLWLVVLRDCDTAGRIKRDLRASIGTISVNNLAL